MESFCVSRLPSAQWNRMPRHHNADAREAADNSRPRCDAAAITPSLQQRQWIVHHACPIIRQSRPIPCESHRGRTQSCTNPAPAVCVSAAVQRQAQPILRQSCPNPVPIPSQSRQGLSVKHKQNANFPMRFATPIPSNPVANPIGSPRSLRRNAKVGLLP